MESDIQRQKNPKNSSGSLLYPQSILQQLDNDSDEHLVGL
ncbi:MAG: hypothetical protein K0S67_341 [Nitrososphaeraceae archaeon]|nr:hypothetical protein [Nitrososphaeraceae archaeon]